MAIVGHFSLLSEAEKLVQSRLLQGIVQETYEEGGLASVLPGMIIDGKSILYNRENTLPSADFYDIHEQIPWTADVDYATQVEVSLKRAARQDVLDKFIMDTYKDPNDYRTLILKQLRKGVMRTIETNFIYGDATTYPKQYDGINMLCPAGAGNAFVDGDQDQDMGGGTTGLSVATLRDCIDMVKPKPDILLMRRSMRNRLSAAAWEVGVSANAIGRISYGKNDFGARITYFDDIPIMVSDYLNTETDNTGASDSSSDLSSVYAIKLSQVMEGGLCMVTGGTATSMDMFKMIELSELEDYDAGGIRLVCYCALALGSTKGIARIHSIDETAAVTS